MLVREGIGREDITVVANNTDIPSDRGARDETDSDHRSFGDRVSNLFGSLFGADLDDEHRGYYSEAVRRGGVMVTVNVDEGRVERVVEIMNDHDAVDIDRRADYYRESGYKGFDRASAPYTAEESQRERELLRSREREQGEIRIPVVEEDLRVGKRQVQRGGVRVYNRVQERPVEQDVNLREEHVSVERRPVNRPVSESDMGNLREGVIEVTETAEEPVVAKRARVAEEVVINKEVGERTKTVRDTVRRTNVEVEDINETERPAADKARNRR